MLETWKDKGIEVKIPKRLEDRVSKINKYHNGDDYFFIAYLRHPYNRLRIGPILASSMKELTEIVERL